MEDKNELEPSSPKQIARERVIQLIQENWKEDSDHVAVDAVRELVGFEFQESRNEIISLIFKHSDYWTEQLA